MLDGTDVKRTPGSGADRHAATMQEDPGEHGGLEHEDIERDSARRARSAMRSRIWSLTRFKIQRKEWDDQYSRRHLGKRQTCVVGLTPAQENVSIIWGKGRRLIFLEIDGRQRTAVMSNGNDRNILCLRIIAAAICRGDITDTRHNSLVGHFRDECSLLDDISGSQNDLGGCTGILQP